MSSTGVLFTADQTLSPGRKVEVSISWPHSLELVTRGAVVRSEDGRTALQIQRHEFHTGE